LPSDSTSARTGANSPHDAEAQVLDRLPSPSGGYRQQSPNEGFASGHQNLHRSH
jgi:hypothetical protein